MERHAGVLGGRVVDSDEVAVNRVCGGDVWHIRALWGKEYSCSVFWGQGREELC